MYVHAYQSLIWNSTVSSKLALHGLQPRIGDLVAKHPGAEKIERKDVVVLTAENIGDYDIYDVVLPLVGHDIVWPENETKDWMEEAFTKGEVGKNEWVTNQSRALPRMLSCLFSLIF